jgi:hypothetical protein
VSNLVINSSDSGPIGFFGAIGNSASLTNLGLENVSVSSAAVYPYGIGGLCGGNSGSITNCFVSGTVTTGDSASFIGGLCGENIGPITNCFMSGTVTAGDYACGIGGLCGAAEGLISNCFAVGNATVGDDAYGIGGLCGMIQLASINDCYAANTISVGANASGIGGLCGDDASSVVSNSFWDTDVSGILVSAGGTGATTAEMYLQSTYRNAGWDFVGETANGTDDIWYMPGYDYPRLTWEDEYILTCEDYNITNTIAGGTDYVVDANDVDQIIDYVNENKTGQIFVVAPTNPNYDSRYNLDRGSQAINVADLNAIVNFVNANKEGELWMVQCEKSPQKPSDKINGRGGSPRGRFCLFLRFHLRYSFALRQGYGGIKRRTSALRCFVPA